MGSTSIKAVHKTLMKLSPDRSIFGSTGKAATSKMTSQLSKKNLAMTMKENLPSISENSVQVKIFDHVKADFVDDNNLQINGIIYANHQGCT